VLDSLGVFGKGKRLPVFSGITTDLKKSAKNKKAAKKKKAPLVGTYGNSFATFEKNTFAQSSKHTEDKGGFFVNSSTVVAQIPKKTKRKIIFSYVGTD